MLGVGIECLRDGSLEMVAQGLAHDGHHGTRYLPHGELHVLLRWVFMQAPQGTRWV